MAGAGCWRRRRIRPAVQYALIAFFLFNFCLAFIFYQRNSAIPTADIDASAIQSDNAPVAASNSFEKDDTDREPDEILDTQNNRDLLPGESREDVLKSFDDNLTQTLRAETKNHAKPSITDAQISEKLETDAIRKEHTSAQSGDHSQTKEHILLRRISSTKDFDLLESYEHRSKKPKLYNWHLLKNGGSAVDVIVAVQIHDRASYLAYLFDSFRRVRSWDNTIIVLSHDFYSVEIDSMVRNCTFAPIVDIYYPISNQIFKSKFPGEDPRDCTRDMNPESAKKQGCYNANYPDTYGHYREARFAQTKLHWIWKLHYIFDVVIPENIPSFDGQLLLLEEDHYVSPDFLHVLRLASKMAPENIRIVTLGNYKDMPFGEQASRFASNKWVSSRLNMGMSLKSSTWKLIKTCVKTFCDFDDYNWDWSLQFTAIQCIEGNLYTLYARSSRIFHVGECAGTHFKKKCVASEKVDSIKELLSDNANSLFPSTLSIEDGVASISQLRPKANGGWGDPRDRVVCRALATGSYLEVLKAVDRAQTEPI